MAAEAVPMQARAILVRPWVRFAARAILGVLAIWVLHLAEGRDAAFQEALSSTFRYDVWRWLAFIGAAVGAGLLFGLAVTFPFSRVHYRWNRLLLAALAGLPLALFWLTWGYLLQHGHTLRGWLATVSVWSAGTGMQFALAVLVGVAVASGLREQRE